MRTVSAASPSPSPTVKSGLEEISIERLTPSWQTSPQNSQSSRSSDPPASFQKTPQGDAVPSSTAQVTVPVATPHTQASWPAKFPQTTGSRKENPLLTLPGVFGKVQIVPNPLAGEELTLQKAISRALAYNRTILAARLNLRASKISYDNAWDTMYTPSINLISTSNSAFTFGHIPGPINDANGNSTNFNGFPKMGLQLQLAQYTLFNFWKDQDVFEQARLDWVRTQEQYLEQVRSLRNQVITGFFRLKAEAEKLDAAQRSVTIAEAFVGVLKSRLRINKATANDLSSSEVDLLNARINYGTELTTFRVQLWGLNQLLGDPIGISYTIKEKIKFVPVRMTADQGLRIYMEYSPAMKDKRKDIKKAELSLDVTQKNRLPLPKVVFDGVTLNYGNDYNTMNNSLYGSSANSANLDISAQMSLTLPILGPGGLFNSRVVEQSEIGLEQANLAFITQATSDQIGIVQAIRQIIQAENNVKNNTEAFEKSLSILEQLSTQLTAGTVNRLELRDALNQSRTFEFQLEDSKVDHLQNKLNLAQLIGLDRLPGDPY